MTDGLAVLLAWLEFLAFGGLLAWLVLRHRPSSPPSPIRYRWIGSRRSRRRSPAGGCAV